MKQITVRGDRAAPDTIRDSIDRQIRHWLADAPAQLAVDARRPFEAVDNRFRGRFLVAATRALPGEYASETAITAATTVELLFGQAWLNERAAGFVTDRSEEIDRTRALLASDYLHSIAYASVDDVSKDPKIGRSWYRVLAQASERLAECWARSAREVDRKTVPIEPIVTATAGRFATLVADTPEYHDELGATGAVLGIARWQSKTDANVSVLPSEVLPKSLSGIEPASVNAVETIRDLLAPVPESDGLNALQTLAESIVGTAETEIKS